MDKAAILRKVESILDEAERNQTYVVVELDIRGGKVVLVRTIKTEKVETKGNNSHVQPHQR